MHITAIMPAHNEGWIVGLSLRVALLWCDSAVVLNHASTDATAAILDTIADEHPGRVTILHEPDECWDEMQHRQMMLQVARDHGATHIAIVDADEVLTGNLLDRIRAGVELLAPGQIVLLPIYNLRGGLNRYHINGTWGRRITSVVFADDPKLHWHGDRFHHREPMGGVQLTDMVSQGDGGVMHLWGASERRLIAKHRKYKMIERLRWPQKPVSEIDELYSIAVKGRPGEKAANWAFAPVPFGWWQPYSRLMQFVALDETPSQEAECEALIERHGERMFQGLDLFRAEVMA